jgi:prepilin-type N-terminal cleavage/methylation domain-containing protein
MNDRSTKRTRGFSLLEMVVAMALGGIVLAAAVQLYTQGVNATWAVSQRAEMQQDFRASSNLLIKDLSLAGAGLGNGAAIALATSTTLPVLGCDQTSTCYINGAAKTYPVQGSTPYLYGLIPGYNAGPTVSTPPGATDVVTVAYTDNTFYLNCYKATITNTTTVTFSLPSPLTCTLPSGMASPQSVSDSVVGLTPGDLVLFSYSPQVIGEVTSVSGSVAHFIASDPLKMNQPTKPNSLGQVATGTVATGTRLLVITYYIDNTVTPSRLMRQVSGHTPMPVADSMVYMKFSYDLYDSSSNTVKTGSVDGGASLSPALLPNQITKINILHMAVDSPLKGSKGFYGLDLETSVSARDLTYNNNYPLPPS